MLDTYDGNVPNRDMLYYCVIAYRDKYLDRAAPGTRLFKKIHNSMPIRGARLLADKLSVESIRISYMMNKRV